MVGFGFSSICSCFQKENSNGLKEKIERNSEASICLMPILTSDV